ncbi:MAG: hypothetical protein DRI39_01230 [Chloroflexi bacterium]|nr:MAG: hypothetical protein DRI39_01230 [Chloroflexota bacterium]
MLSDLNSVLFVTLLPLIIVAQAVVVIWLVAHFGSDSIPANQVFQTALEKLAEAVPASATLSDAERLQLLLLSQFNFYLLLIPAMIAIGFATFSIVDEKLSRSLEPLLATPVRTWELLLGKALSGAIPALLVTWVCAGCFLLCTVLLGWGHLLSLMITPSWFLTMFLLTPTVALLSFILGIIGSSRASDSKSAQNLAVLIVIPVLVIIGVQLTGRIWFTTLPTLLLALGVGLVDVLGLLVATRLFQRESIVVKWR